MLIKCFTNGIRGRRTLESRNRTDESRMDDMEGKLRQLTEVAETSENRYTEVIMGTSKP